MFELPKTPVRKWTSRHKELVVLGVVHNRISFEDAVALYDLSADELTQWMSRHKLFGRHGLNVGLVQYVRGVEARN